MFLPRRRTLTMPLVLACWSAGAGLGRAAAQQATPCPAAGMATLIGMVHDRYSRVPLAGASVAAAWAGAGDRTARATTDSTGRALLCAPAGQPVTLRASYHDVRGAPQTVLLSMEHATTRAVAVEATSYHVRGGVFDQSSGAPMADVAVSIANTPLATATTAAGRFEFERVPVGQYQLRFSHLGYAPVHADLRVEADDLDADVRMTAAAIPLDPVRVTAFSRRLDQVGFYERERRGVGVFLGRRQIESMRAQESSDLLRNMPGIRLVPQPPRRNAQRNDLSGRNRCRFSFIVDGARTLPDFEMDYVAPYAIEGIEVYRSMAEVPAAFRPHVNRDGGNAGCGVVAIWTRNSH